VQLGSVEKACIAKAGCIIEWGCNFVSCSKGRQVPTIVYQVSLTCKLYGTSDKYGTKHGPEETTWVIRTHRQPLWVQFPDGIDWQSTLTSMLTF